MHTRTGIPAESTGTGLILPLFAGILVGLLANITALIGGASLLTALGCHAVFGLAAMLSVTLGLMALRILARLRLQFGAVVKAPSLAG